MRTTTRSSLALTLGLLLATITAAPAVAGGAQPDITVARWDPQSQTILGTEVGHTTWGNDPTQQSRMAKVKPGSKASFRIRVYSSGMAGTIYCVPETWQDSGKFITTVMSGGDMTTAWMDGDLPGAMGMDQYIDYMLRVKVSKKAKPGTMRTFSVNCTSTDILTDTAQVLVHVK